MWIVCCLFTSLLFSMRVYKSPASRGFCKKITITFTVTRFPKDRLNRLLELRGRQIELILSFTHLNRLI